ncbi:MAG TPA: 1,2-phenylacetyl-CoA epoxidase subunit PaaD [Gemmatimonadales bacterium]|nr:1,2-phenylacetyl-CoA epoxidase subunit PaaD [Gemmatimonadales bacterium]
MVERADGQGPALNGARAAEALAALDEVKDPEVPALSVVELGVVREIEAEEGRVTVTLTPTYSGCPAMKMIEDEVRARLARAGFGEILVRTVYSPPWTTDWIPEAAREKLRAYGIAPPGKVSAQDLVPIGRATRTVACPFCGSTDTVLESEFGATACKSLHVCRACHQPFEHFKPF